MSSGLRATGEGLVCLIGAVVCLCAAPRVQLFVSAGNGRPHNAPRYHWLTTITATSEIAEEAVLQQVSDLLPLLLYASTTRAITTVI